MVGIAVAGRGSVSAGNGGHDGAVPGGATGHAGSPGDIGVGVGQVEVGEGGGDGVGRVTADIAVLIDTSVDDCGVSFGVAVDGEVAEGDEAG